MLIILQINANTIVLHDFTDSQGSEQLVESLAPHLRRKYLTDLSLIGKDFDDLSNTPGERKVMRGG